MLQNSRKKVGFAVVGAALLSFVLVGVSSEGDGAVASDTRNGAVDPAADTWLAKLFGAGKPVRSSTQGANYALINSGGAPLQERDVYAAAGQSGEYTRAGYSHHSAGTRSSRPGPAASMSESMFGGAHVQGLPLEAAMVPPSRDPQAYRVKIGEEQKAMEEFDRKRPSQRAQAKRASEENGKLLGAAGSEGASPQQGAAGHTGCAFADAVGADLLEKLKHADTACVDSQFNLSRDDALRTFTNEKMVTVADEIARLAQTYDGDNDQDILQLIIFVKAGYYNQFKYRDQGLGAFNAAVVQSVRAGLDAFFNNNVTLALENNVHGEILAEAVILIDSARENTRFVPKIRSLLGNYDAGYDNLYFMERAINNCFHVLFNQGVELPGFTSQVASTLADTLSGLIRSNIGKLGGGKEYLVLNAARELSRQMRYPGSIKTYASTKVDELTDLTAFNNATAPLRTIFGQYVESYDRDNCQRYGLCNYKDDLREAVLPVQHACSPTISIRAQSISGDELRKACDSVAGEQAYFHRALATGSQAVGDDNNASLEMVIFDSSSDYGRYSNAIYGNSSNNGGIYLEGNPAVVGNQPRFIAYEAEWVRPTFQIWNLEHEFVHYLDGRYNLYGDFMAGFSQGTVWWTEGLAEYISWSYLNQDNARAREEAARKPWTLSQLFQTEYGDQSRVYQGGYLAVRYMFEKRASDVNTILSYLRPGRYADYKQRIAAIGTSYDGDFSNWLTCVADGTACQPVPECTAADTRQMDRNCARSNISQTRGNHAHFYILVPPGTPSIRVTATGGNGNADLFANTQGRWAYKSDHNYWSMNAGNEESIVMNNPPGGQYVYITLYGEQDFSGVRLTATY
ncbi:collagenase [Lysobacter sp. CA196]|uniref:M9 family metallopeptidase n=1 Tax=Lysobacter sp. CA196 TaxID=3455606 RepID=UPI003F8D44D2